jgi:hypothetical protein
LLLVRLPVGRRRDGAPDDTGDGDQGEDVGQRLEQHGGRPRVLRQPLREGAREAEQQAGGGRAERAPVAEDHRRQRDEAAAGGHVLVEGVHEPD